MFQAKFSHSSWLRTLKNFGCPCRVAISVLGMFLVLTTFLVEYGTLRTLDRNL
jgi:hypothetical protein